ncbi:MAG TPA: TetR family transcriptional regulator [Devosiaceae bacterium]|jgi:AcrR family transcriptional regulator|nr:TetR family transcriptional regulator [Devosiaceae bacterium]
MARDAQATRERLVSAARQAFSRGGFEGTTVRSIAADAGVTPALINRYFGGKEQLFAEAVAIDLAFPDLSEVDRSHLGVTLAEHFFRRWEGRQGDDLLRVLIRTAATNRDAALRIRTILTDQVGPMVERVAGPARARERAALIATQILGLAYGRYVVGLSDHDLPHATVLAMVGGTIQRYLVDKLP